MANGMMANGSSRLSRLVAMYFNGAVMFACFFSAFLHISGIFQPSVLVLHIFIGSNFPLGHKQNLSCMKSEC